MGAAVRGCAYAAAHDSSSRHDLTSAILPTIAAECPDMRRVPVYLAVDAPVGGGNDRRAREEAGWILRSLCAAVDWREADRPTAADPGPRRAGERRVNAGRARVGDAEPRPGESGSRVPGRIRERVEASGGNVSLPILLGTVIAHEIGHLLLHSTGHSSEGVMIANYGKREWRRLPNGIWFSRRPIVRLTRP